MMTCDSYIFLFPIILEGCYDCCLVHNRRFQAIPIYRAIIFNSAIARTDIFFTVGWCGNSFVVCVYDRVYIWQTAVANFNGVLVEDFVKSVLFREMLFDKI